MLASFRTAILDLVLSSAVRNAVIEPWLFGASFSKCLSCDLSKGLRYLTGLPLILIKIQYTRWFRPISFLDLEESRLDMRVFFFYHVQCECVARTIRNHGLPCPKKWSHDQGNEYISNQGFGLGISIYKDRSNEGGVYGHQAFRLSCSFA